MRTFSGYFWKPEIWLEEIVAGAPFFLGEADSDGDGFGDSLASGLALGLAEGAGDSAGDGLGEGEAFRFFFRGEPLGEVSGEGLGEDFFFLGEADGLDSDFSVGVGLVVAFFLGEGDFAGVAVGFGVGDFSALAFFFECLRGVGVGVGANIFLSLLPSDSSAVARTATFVRIATAANPMANTRHLAVIPSAVEESRGASRDVRRGPSTSLCSARDDTPNYFFASSARTALFRRIPPSRFSRGKFSFGE